MTKVLRILNRLNVGGPTYNVAALSLNLDPTYETRVLAGFNEPNEANSGYILDAMGIPYEYVPGMRRAINAKNDWKAYNYIKKVINDWQPNIVHTHAAKAGALGRLAAHHARNRPKVILHTYHGNVFDGYFSPLKTNIILTIERYLCSLSDAVIAISETQKKDLTEKYKIAPPEKIHVVKLGFDLTRFITDNELKRIEFRRHYNISDDTVVISIIGRLAPIKNHDLLINALAILLKSKSQVKIKTFVVGEGELFNFTVQAAKNLGLTCCLPDEFNYDADIIFTSWRKDIDVINAGTDIVALTSLNEGTPVSIIEALASGKATISTDAGGVRDVITDGVTGFVTSLDPVAFSNKLSLLVDSRDLRNEMGKKGRDSVLQTYSYTRLVKDVEALYAQLIKK